MQMKIIEFAEALARIADKVIKMSSTETLDSDSEDETRS